MISPDLLSCQVHAPQDNANEGSALRKTEMLLVAADCDRVDTVLAA